MAAKAKLTKLDQDLKEKLLNKIQDQRLTISDIHNWLVKHNVEISRSSVGRYAKKEKEYLGQIQELKSIAENFARQVSTSDEVSTQRLIGNLLNTQLLDTMLAEQKNKQIKLSDLRSIARILKEVAEATQGRTKLLESFKEQQSKNTEKVGKRLGFDQATIELLKAELNK